MERLLDDQNAPASKADILDVGTRIDEKFDRLRSEVKHSYRDLGDRVDHGFARLLNVFYGLAEAHGKRLDELDSNQHAIRSRLSTVENRVMELEKRLITPPSG
jgi:hypothetical protein